MRTHEAIAIGLVLAVFAVPALGERAAVAEVSERAGEPPGSGVELTEDHSDAGEGVEEDPTDVGGTVVDPDRSEFGQKDARPALPGDEGALDERSLADELAGIRDPWGAETDSGSIGLDEVAGSGQFASDEEQAVAFDVSATGRVEIAPEGGRTLALEFDGVSSALDEVDSGGILAYGMQGDASLVPQVDDHVFRALFAVEHAQSPAEYAFHVTGEGGEVLAPQSDGSIIVLDTDGEESAYIGAPWARTAQNAEVPTAYRVEGTSITQVVDLEGLPDSAFPVIADPAVYVNSVTRKVINVKNHGRVAKWKRVGSCQALRKAPACSVKAEFQDERSVQVALGISRGSVTGSLGFTAASKKKYGATCKSRPGPSKAQMYQAAKKKTYRIQKTVKRGVPGIPGHRMKTTITKSGTLVAYSAGNDWTCAVS
ncbi:hypothetical protein K8P10_002082 [Leucobacter sp. Psy1]|uniref:hypothetical protein n=1 Tax=Leucobacter sp. Psy1 TaxID=2875729 RepID=UPI001CD35866|nr:hypothetical protein [Leucobacter sp. Psy1]UBH06571.1 hypothetical protein K8P10_002082 [Leucobacter sp. Psy1]